MSQHDSLGEACGAAGVLHVDNVVAVDVAFHLEERVVVDVTSQEQQLGGVEHASVFLHTDVNHILHAGEPLTLQVASLALPQFGQHFVGHVNIIALPSAVGDAECVHVGVLAQILQLALFVIRVHRDEYGADLGRGIEEGEPVGHVGGPDAYIETLLYADGDEALGQVVYTPVELFIGEAQVAVAIYDIFFVGGCGGPMLKPLPQCTF